MDLIFGDLITLPNSFGAPPWGLYQGGAPVILADNVVSLEYVKEYSNADYPLEPGPGGTGPLSFESYDKVEHPFAVTLQFSKGGSIAARTAFLQSIDAAMQSMTLYDVYSSDKVYYSVSGGRENILRRTADNGAGLAKVEVRFDQIRDSSQSAFQNTGDPSGAGQQDGGLVQGQLTSQQQDQAIASGLY